MIFEFRDDFKKISKFDIPTGIISIFEMISKFEIIFGIISTFGTMFGMISIFEMVSLAFGRPKATGKASLP